METLAVPRVNKTIATLASVPFSVELYRGWLGGRFSFSRTALGIKILVLIVLMMLPPVRIRPGPKPGSGMLNLTEKKDSETLSQVCFNLS